MTSTRLIVVAVALTLVFMAGVLELVRRRRLQERYSLLWFLTVLVTVVVAAVPSALDHVAATIGIAYPPTALFFVAGIFGLAMLLHFSVTISRLSEECKSLAQHVALLRQELDGVRDARPPDPVAEGDAPAVPDPAGAIPRGDRT